MTAPVILTRRGWKTLRGKGARGVARAEFAKAARAGRLSCRSCGEGVCMAKATQHAWDAHRWALGTRDIARHFSTEGL